MPSVYGFKPAFQNLLRPVVRAAVGLGLTPNHLTLAALAGSIAAGASIAAWPARRATFVVLPAWLLARMALNAMDGMAAREHGMKTPLGAVLNELGDVVSDVGLYLPVAALGPTLRWPAVAFAIGGVFTEFGGVLGQALGARRHYEGPMGKSDRALLMGSLGLIATFAPATRAWWPWVLWVAAGLALVTCVNRLRSALRELSQAGPAAPGSVQDGHS
jgi:CDP-diacylglycerol--glycerol-3-phosphate 3-phosphatidyltransferase